MSEPGWRVGPAAQGDSEASAQDIAIVGPQSAGNDKEVQDTGSTVVVAGPSVASADADEVPDTPMTESSDSKSSTSESSDSESSTSESSDSESPTSDSEASESVTEFASGTWPNEVTLEQMAGVVSPVATLSASTVTHLAELCVQAQAAEETSTESWVTPQAVALVALSSGRLEDVAELSTSGLHRQNKGVHSCEFTKCAVLMHFSNRRGLLRE